MAPEQRHLFRDIAKVVSASDTRFSQGERLSLLRRSAEQGSRSPLFVDEGRELLDFSRCGYTGLASDRRLLEGAHQCLDALGALNWSVARTRLQPKVLRELEEQLGELFRARVVTYSSVSLASASVLPLLASSAGNLKQSPLVVFDSRAHASLQAVKAVVADETEVTTIRHEDWEELEKLCRQRRCLYVCDGVWSTGGGIDVARLRALQDRWGLAVYVDDAHGVAIRGKTGEGYVRSLLDAPVPELTFVATSLSKGFGASGGAVLVFGEAEESLLRHYGLASAFSHSLNAAAIGAAKVSAAILGSAEAEDIQIRLQQRIRQFDSQVETPWRGDGLPIRRITTKSVDDAFLLASGLLERGIFVSPVFFPTVPRSEPGVRICLSAAHTPQDVERLTTALRECDVPVAEPWLSSTDGAHLPTPISDALRRIGTWEMFDWVACRNANAQLIFSDRLVSRKHEVPSSQNKPDPRSVAAERMLAAARHRLTKRGPLRVARAGTGQYDVIDGNATLQALRASGWFGELPVTVDLERGGD